MAHYQDLLAIKPSHLLPREVNGKLARRWLWTEELVHIMTEGNPS
jgi:hypothetical protein